MASNSAHDPTGAGFPGMPEFLVVGKLRAPHGLRGELLMEVITDFPERIRPGTQVFIGDDHRLERVRSCRNALKGMLIAFDGYDTPETAGLLRNLLVFTRTADLPPLAEGEYYHHQLLGLVVVDEDGKRLGVLAEILVSPANDVYVIRREEAPDLLLPAIGEVLREIDLERGKITVRVPAGIEG